MRLTPKKPKKILDYRPSAWYDVGIKGRISMNPNGKYFEFPIPELSISKREKRKLEKTGRCEVTYPVSYSYNGGVYINPDGTLDYSYRNTDSKWYDGVKVPSPVIPKGYELVGIGVGLQLNAFPPYATKVLRKIETFVN